MQLRDWAAMLAATASLVACAGAASAQETAYLVDNASPFGEVGVNNAEAGSVAMPKLAYSAGPEAAADFDKYYYFHRGETDFATAYADIRECDGYARGLQSGVGAVYTGQGVLGDALGNAMADAIYGSANRRKMRRTNMRACMSFKGYARYGLTKDLWDTFNFEEGFSGLNEDKRDAFLRQQALVASSAKPETQELGL